MTARGPPRPPLVYRLFRDASGQSETFGMLLLLAMTVAGTTAIIAYGSQALDETERASSDQRTEHTMTLLDSRAAMVALGDSEQQDVRFSGSGDGRFTVDSDSGWIRITHYNYSGEGDDEVLYNESMGRLVYENGDTQIAYQGGGVWRTEDGGSARMVSKPEFHYRGATLTLPIIRINSEGHAAGTVTTTVRSGDEARRIYPNASGSYESPTAPFSNPIENGTINVTVHSDYYRAWAEYFRTRTATNVTVYDHNRTVHMQLLTLSDVGDFDTLGNDLGVGGYPEGHTLTNFTVTLQNDKTGDGTFSSLHWSFYADPGNQKFEMHVTPNDKCDEIRDGDGTIHVSYFYENASSSQSQEWENTNIQNESDAIESIDCESDYQSVTVNFTATDTNMTYEQIDGVDTSTHVFADSYGDLGTASFDQHDADAAKSVDPYDPDASPAHEENMSFLLNHYFALLGPNFELKGSDGPGGSSRIDEDESFGTLTYDQSGDKFLTYLHVTENEVEVEVG